MDRGHQHITMRTRLSEIEVALQNSKFGRYPQGNEELLKLTGSQLIREQQRKRKITDSSKYKLCKGMQNKA
jgi:hypothetical protein